MKLLYEQLRPIAKHITVITIFVAPSDGSVILCSRDETFSATAQGTSLPLTAPAPLPASTIPPTLAPPIADTTTVEALYAPPCSKRMSRPGISAVTPASRTRPCRAPDASTNACAISAHVDARSVRRAAARIPQI